MTTSDDQTYRRPTMNAPLRSLLTVAVSVLAALLLLEALLWFLPVNSGLRTQPVNKDDPILHFEPDRQVTWSRLPDFSLRNRARVNNYGFVSDLDYEPGDERPLVAVIGDSYVEAAMVPWAETLHGRLDRALEPDARAYSFGASGAPLSQYLACAAWVSETFAPQRMVFVIVANDYDESLLRPGSAPGFHYFSGPDLDLVRLDYEPGPATRLLRLSSLARYLVFHLHAPEMIRGLQGGGEQYVGQTSAEADRQRLEDSQRAVDAFLDRLPKAAGLSSGHILFLVDGLRPELYDPERLEAAQESFAARMRGYFLERARSLGYLVQDLQPRFMAEFADKGLKFEFPRDAHWNGLGHETACRAVLDSGLLDGLGPTP